MKLEQGCLIPGALYENMRMFNAEYDSENSLIRPDKT
jgi:hypothetical protein